MSITDELRKWAEGNALRAGMSLRTARDQVLAIADRIDAEHEAKVSYWQGASYKDGYDEGFASADDWIAQHEDAMAEHGWVRLPKDADGEPIHMGDLVTVPWKDKVYEVAGFSCTKQLCSGIRTIWIDVYSPEKHRNVPLCGADSCRHYHAPTVEDVLREFADEIQRCCDTADTIAEYAAKLMLKED